MTHSEASVGVSNLCGVMAKPTELAWRCGVHVVKWLQGQRLRGVRHSANGDPAPAAHSDASDKPDPVDGECQCGYHAQWMGGPITHHSSKLHHVGLNAFHDECMGLCHASECVVWLRQSLGEMDLNEAITDPAVVHGDDDASIHLTVEDFVSTGNQYVYPPCHYNKEVAGSVCSKKITPPSSYRVWRLIPHNQS